MSFRATLTRLKQTAQNVAHSHHTPNAPLQLDPALSQLLHDTDLSLLRKFRHGSKHYVGRPELQVEETDAFSKLPSEFEGYEVVERDHEPEEASSWDGPREERRSPAAVYGTKHVGMVVLPWELEHGVGRVIEESDKHQLRSDAKRLFFYPSPNAQPATSSSGPSKIARRQSDDSNPNRPPEWQLSSTAPSLSFSTKGNYKTIVQNGPREGLAFTTIAMSAHYAATANVFRELSRRMAGPGKGQDRIETIVDFGGKSGQALWAALIAFRESIPAPEAKEESFHPIDENANPASWTPISASPHHPRVGPSSKPPTPTSVMEKLKDESASLHDDQTWTASTVKKYMLLDSRRGLTELARRLVKGTDIGGCEVLYQDYWGKNTQLSTPERSLAVCAFTLSELPSGTSRKRMVTEMWESGAEWMAIIDHGTSTGFDCVARARELLLELGRKDVASQAQQGETASREAGSHVVAPCPHSHACPLHSSPHTRDICHFTQRVQTPPFLRHTKHSREGHEDVAYSYVVIRRGKGLVTHHSEQYGSPVASGLVGAVGREEAEKALLDGENSTSKRKGKTGGRGKDKHGRRVLEVGSDGVWSGLREVEVEPEAESRVNGSSSHTQEEQEASGQGGVEPEEVALHSAIGTWPRIVYPPMKRSGHVILDTCTNEGSIARITIPRSQGKQAYYDARKANWGDAFPHAPRITPLVRTRGIRKLGPVFAPTTSDGAGVESSSLDVDDGAAKEEMEFAAGDGDRTDELEFEPEIEMPRKVKTKKDKSKRKGLRETRRRANAMSADLDTDMDMENWINQQASELATQIQSEMERDMTSRPSKVD